MNYYRRISSGFLTPKLLLCKSGSKKYTNTKSIDAENNEMIHSRKPSDFIAPEIVSPQNFYSPPRQVWVENFDAIKEEKKGIINLHPKIFAAMPRLDVIAANIRWQSLYRKVDRTNAKTRAECPGSGKKPWPQKGLGKARQGSRRAPQFIKGGVCHGPRDPTTHFYMLSVNTRVTGLTSALSVKFAQGDIRVIENLDMPTDSPDFILGLIDERMWGCSVLFVDREDVMPLNIVAATRDIGHVNLMPVYGLNVFSILKHECLVLTLDAVKEIENRLLTAMQTPRNIDKQVYENFPFK